MLDGAAVVGRGARLYLLGALALVNVIQHVRNELAT